MNQENNDPIVYEANPQEEIKIPIDKPTESAVLNENNTSRVPDGQEAEILAETKPEINNKPLSSMPQRTIEWSAKEDVVRQKGALWYIVTAIIFVGISIASVFWMKNFTFPVLLAAIYTAIIVTQRRSSREIQYSLSYDQLDIDSKVFQLDSFKSFGILKSETTNSAVLIPNKRFSPAVVVYFPKDKGEAVVDILGAVLPMEDVKDHPIDKLADKLNL